MEILKAQLVPLMARPLGLEARERNHKWKLSRPRGASFTDLAAVEAYEILHCIEKWRPAPDAFDAALEAAYYKATGRKPPPPNVT